MIEVEFNFRIFKGGSCPKMPSFESFSSVFGGLKKEIIALDWYQTDAINI